MLTNYLKFILRMLRKNKVSTGINLLGLSLGLTACLAIFLIAHFELSYDRFHPDGERIYRVVGQFKMRNNEDVQPIGFIPRAAPQAIREEVAGLETVAAFHNIESDVIIPDGSATGKQFKSQQAGNTHAQIILAEPQYFDIFKYEWLTGNLTTALQDPYKVVLSEPKARLYFGDIPLHEMLGRQVIYHDSIRTEVTGIVRAWAENTDLTFTDFISHSTINASVLKEEINLREWNDIWSASQAFVKLAPGSTVAQVEAGLQRFAARHFGPDHGTGEFTMIPTLQPLSDLHFNADYQDNYSRKAHLATLYGLMGIAGFILLIAAINFINLATARSVQRAKDVGIRKVLGSSRLALMRQFMGETLLLTGIAVVVALLAIPVVLAQFRSFIPPDFHFSGFSLPIALFLLAITAATTLLAGFYPAWVLSAYQPAATLKGASQLASSPKGRLRQGLIVFQFVVSLVFIIGTIVVSSQINFMRHKDLGFQSAGVITISAPRGPANQLATLKPKIQQLAGVHDVTLQIFEPMGENYGLDHIVYRGKTVRKLDAAYKMGDENFIPFYQMKLLAGRNFMPGDSPREFVVSTSLVNALGFQQPAEALGIQLEWHDKFYPIVGVVADFHQQSMHEKMPPTFITTAQHPGSMGIKLRAGTFAETQATLAQLSQLWTAVYPDQPFEYRYLDATIATFYAKEEQTAGLVHLATAIAVLISCMGLFGLITFMAEQRRKEIGVRKVLGASVASITGLLTSDFLKLVLIALIIASPIAYWAMQRWLADFAYRVEIQWWMFGAAALAAILITFLTVGFQSVQAALANPVKSLRNE